MFNCSLSYIYFHFLFVPLSFHGESVSKRPITTLNTGLIDWIVCNFKICIFKFWKKTTFCKTKGHTIPYHTWCCWKDFVGLWLWRWYFCPSWIASNSKQHPILIWNHTKISFMKFTKVSSFFLNSSSDRTGDFRHFPSPLKEDRFNRV